VGERRRRRASATFCAGTLAGLLSLVPCPATSQPLRTRGDLYAPAGAATDSLPPPLPREFRAVWVATVANIDWPSRPGLPVDSQKAELLALMDRARQLHLNAIIFQVRPSGDALYPSKIEPWSYFLTGAMGRAPAPFWDPLAFAIAAAHARGMELHAWFNPYRAHHPRDTSPIAANHLSRTHPRLVKRYGPFQWMDPGEAEVRRQTLRVVHDVVERYDVDGVHIDDYFYPYPERDRRRRDIPFPDDRSWHAYRAGGGGLSRDDWRRHNVDLLVQALYQDVKETKPWVKFGVSPFGIWRPGNPPSVQGFDAWDRLYADSRKWITEGWVDYWTPQLYWRASAPQQPYGDLLDWWIAQNPRGRYVWPGNYTGRASGEGTWPASEIVDQIGLTRQRAAMPTGNVHFSMRAFVIDRDSLVERLIAGPYAAPALVPAMPWLVAGTPEAPSVRRVDGTQGVDLEIRPAGSAPAGPDRSVASRGAPPARGSAAPADRTRAAPSLEGLRASTVARWWVVRARYGDGWRAIVTDADDRLVRLAPEGTGALPDLVFVTAVDRAGQESPIVRLP
jgi:uncharacterized lipoprotein YddW (UPF0748 family)